MRVDYHTHTKLCKHATGMPADYVAAAVDRGIDEIGLSDHTPMPPWYDAAWRMTIDQFPGYLEALDEAVRRFDGKITVRRGLESDFYPGTEDFVRDVIGRADFDYVIGSVHYLDDWGFDNPDHKARYEGRDIAELYREYFAAIRDTARSGLFDIVGHFDLIKKFGHRPDRPVDDAVEEALAAVKEAGMSVELNTSGLRKPCKEVYPSRSILETAHRMGVALTLGSDAHRPDEVGAGFDGAVALLREIGVTHIVRYARRTPEPVPPQ